MSTYTECTVADFTGNYPQLHFPVNCTVDILRGDFIGSYNVKNDVFSEVSEDFAASVFRDCEFSSGGCWSNCKGSENVAWIHVSLSEIPVASSGSDVQNLCSHYMWKTYKYFLTSVTSISTWTKLGDKENDAATFSETSGRNIYSWVVLQPSLTKHLSEKLINNIHILCLLDRASSW